MRANEHKAVFAHPPADPVDGGALPHFLDGDIMPKGRIVLPRCAGLPCAGVRVYRDTPENLWLTFANGFTGGNLPADVGAALVSLDPDAAQYQTNVWALRFSGY